MNINVLVETWSATIGVASYLPEIPPPIQKSITHRQIPNA